MMLLGLAPSVAPPLHYGCSLSFPTTYTYHAPTGTPSGKRHYLFHGFNGSVAQWSSAPYLGLVTALRAAGDSVVLLSSPAPQPCHWTNGGWQVREQFNAALNTVMDAVETLYGAAVNRSGGFSMGGYWAMIAASSNGRIVTWFAHLPVTRVDALTELAGVGNAHRANPEYVIDELSLKPGWLGWGTADYRVNWTLTKAIADQLPATVSKHEYVGQDHTTTAGHVNDILEWLAAI